MPEADKFEILLVDDNPADARLFEIALKEASTRVRIYWVASGPEALDFLKQRGRFEAVGPVQLVLLDIALPGRDGFDILRDIKSNQEISRHPVIVFSSSSSQDDIDLAYSLGANAYFRKPMTLDLYIKQVRVLAEHWLDLAQLPRPGRLLDPHAQKRLSRHAMESSRDRE